MTKRESRATTGTAGIRDVARLAGVSAATVSRVMNGRESVAADLRKRVFVAVDQAGYRPNRIARNLRHLRSDMIGVVVSDIENPHFTEAVRVLEDAAFSRGYRLLLCNSDERVDKQRTYLQMLAGERVGAVIVAPADRLGSGIEALLELDIPTVAFDRVTDNPDIDSVVSDSEDGVRRLTEHFIWLGHRRIVYVGGRTEVETGARRWAGYAAAMRTADLAPFTVAGNFRTDQAETAVRDLLALAAKPTAVVVGNNLMAIGALRAIRAAHIRIPDDLALGTVDDPIWAELIDPPLTALAQPVREMAEAAMRLAFERIEQRSLLARHLVLPMELHVRRSSGGAKSLPGSDVQPARSRADDGLRPSQEARQRPDRGRG